MNGWGIFLGNLRWYKVWVFRASMGGLVGWLMCLLIGQVFGDVCCQRLGYQLGFQGVLAGSGPAFLWSKVAAY